VGVALKEEDHPARTPLCVSQVLWRAERAGSQMGTLCNLIYRQQGEVGIRRILGVLSLAKKFGTAATEDACAAALEMGVHEYRFVRRYLERGPQLSLSGFHSEDEISKLPGVRVIEAADVFPGPITGTYAFSRQTVQRNLYQIPLH